jgi:hypothetical protein
MSRRFAASVLSTVLLVQATPAFADQPPTPPLPPTTIQASHSDSDPSSSPAQGPATSPAASSSVRLTYEATKTGAADRPADAPRSKSPDDASLLHGFRLGYGYVFNYADPSSVFENKSFRERAGLRSPHHFLLGYEVVYRVVGHSWLNVLLMGNGMVAGLEQSKVLPSANPLIGAEIKNSFQIGVGANLSPLKGSEAHTIVAAGWTPKVGTNYTPVHAYFIPAVDGYHRMGVTTGVTF